MEDPIVRPAPQQPVPPADALKQLHKLVLSAPGPASGTRKGGGGGAARGRRGGQKAGGGRAAGGGSGGGPRGMLVVVLDEMDGLIEGHSGEAGGWVRWGEVERWGEAGDG